MARPLREELFFAASLRELLFLACYNIALLECITVHPQLPLVASGQAAGHDQEEVDGSHVQVL